MTKKWITAGCMGIMLLTGFTGCTKTEEALQQTQGETGNKTDMQIPEKSGDKAENQKETDSKTDNQTPEKSGDKAENQKETDYKAENHADTDEMAGQNAQNQSDSDNAADNQSGQSAPQKYNPSEGTEHLGGKIQSVAEDGMIVAQTTVMGEGEDADLVTLVDEKDAKKIPVQFTADTRVEHWIIQGGGAGIDMRDATISDLKSGLGVELEGYYEGENFIATRILIEEYK